MIKSISLMCAIIGMSANASTNIYDADMQAGAKTQYNQGPISEISIESRNAFHISGRFFVTAPDTQCTSAQVINENTWQTIVELDVFGNTALNGALPEGTENQPKSLQITCRNETGTYTVHHKIPAAPQITWNSDVEVSNWVYGSNSWYYENIDYSSNAFINNNAPDGQCYFNKLVGDAPSFIDDKSGVPFDSEYFSTEGSALAGGGADRVFTLVISEIICKNAGGTTRALEVWDLGVDHNKAPYREYTVYSY